MTVKEIEEREKKATKGPWEDERAAGIEGDAYIDSTGPWYRVVGLWNDYNDNSINDADFIAHSREDIPYLLSLIREAEHIIKDAYDDYALQSRGEMDTCKEWLEKVGKWNIIVRDTAINARTWTD
jgi:hypothetical protein